MRNKEEFEKIEPEYDPFNQVKRTGKKIDEEKTNNY